MSNKAYWTIAGLAAVAAVAALIMGRWGNPAYRDYARILGWIAIVVLLILRIFLRPKGTPERAAPRR